MTFTAASHSWSLASLPAGQSVTLQLAGTVPSGATGSTYVNTASASAADASTVTATDSDTLTAHATLGITKTDGVTSVTAGTTDTYTVVVSNTGPSDATNLSVVDTAAQPGLQQHLQPEPAGRGHLHRRQRHLEPGLAAGRPVGHPPAGRHRAVGRHRLDLREHGLGFGCRRLDSHGHRLRHAGTHATLAITKSDNDGGSSSPHTVGSATPGTSITYTVVASNTGPSTATGVTVTDALGSTPPSARTPGRPSDPWGHRLQRLGFGEHQ